ncbi:unnamed protein product, partial [Callosobruchus maculatus]
MRGCRRLIKAVRKVYGEQFGVIEDRLSMDYVTKKKNKKDKNPSRKVSDQTGSTVSPIRRKDSVGRKDKIDKNLDSSLPGKNASKESSRDVLDPEGSETKRKGDEEKTKCDPPPILRYIHAYVKDSFHAPLATLIKGAAVLPEDQFPEIIPVAWQLLLEANQEVAACAASIFILAAVKAPQQVSDIMQHGLSHPMCSVRINAIL